MNKRAIIIVLAIIVAVVGFLLLTDPKDGGAGTPSEHKTGAGTTGVTLVEYGDFQCPACGQFFPIVQQVKAHYGDQITFQFRNFPLESIHKNARAAARAAEAASKQNKFWEMHDMLYETQTQWQDTSNPVSLFEGFAEKLGLDKSKFSEDYKSSEVSGTISADLQAGKNLGVSSTPTFFLNGQKLDPNPQGLDAFLAVIDAKIEELTGKKPETKQTEAKPEESSTGELNQDQ